MVDQILQIPYHKICAELYKRKNFLIQANTPWGIHEKQLYALQLLNSPNVTKIGYGGSARSGKSWIAGEYLTMSCLAYPGTGWGLARKELKNLKRTTLITLFKVFLKYKLKIGVDFVYNQQDQIITFKNGSQIFLIDTAYQPSDPFYTRFGGYELTGLVIDESNESPFQAVEILSGRTGFRKNIEYDLPPRTLEMFNPDKGHVYERFYLPYRDKKETDDRKFIKALPNDNPDPAVKIWIDEQMKTASEMTIQRLIHGNFDYDDTKDKLIEHEAINDYFTNGHVKPGDRKFITADIARMGKDSTVIRVWAGFKVIERKEITKSKITDTATAIKDIANRQAVPMSRTVVDEDGVGCLIKGTMVLTLNGWKPVESIVPGEYIYSKDLNNNLIKSLVTKNEKREVSDIIEDASGVSFSFAHYLPFKSRPEYNFKLSSWDAISEKNKIYFDKDFKFNGKDFKFKLPATKYRMPNGGYKILDNDLCIDSKNFAEFLGWFISEGCIDGKYIRITQNKDSIYNDKIRKCLKSCGFNVYEKDQSNKRAIDYLICNRQLKHWLKENCYTENIYKSFNKKVPQIIKDAPINVIDKFLYSFCDGDGHYHHGERNYSTSSKQLSLDLHELIIKIGKQAALVIKHKKGSTGKIDGRIINRKRDNYLITELKENSACITSKIKRVYEDNVYNLEIESPTKLYLVNFGRRTFFVHNGGVRDILNCHGFIANSKVIGTGNYMNLKAQCTFLMAKLINERLVSEDTKDVALIAKIKQEMDWVREKEPDSDGKRKVISKDDVKEALRRSPDEWDSIMMRGIFELGSKI